MERTIKISDEVHKMLIEIDGKPETFSHIIKRLAEEHHKRGKK